MANFIKFRDTIEFKTIKIADSEINLSSKDNMGQSLSNNGNTPLYVKIAATHAGIITRNNGFYLPEKMAKGASTFVEHYGKPIQVHHNDHEDPVGRVIKAEYIDTSGEIKEKFTKQILNAYRKGQYNDAFIGDFLSGKTSFIQSVNFVSDALNLKNSVLDDKNYQGVGYIELTAAITDPDAKQKILDGRYLTGSIGASTNRAVCSVCKQDWTDSGKCEHSPGKMYDGAKAFIIAGDLTYDEYSLVNTPADKFSRIMEININGVMDSFNMDSSFENTLSVNIITDNVDTENSNDKIEVQASQEELMDKEALLQLINQIKPKYSLLDATDIENMDDLIAEILSPEVMDIDDNQIDKEVRVVQWLEKRTIKKLVTQGANDSTATNIKTIFQCLDDVTVSDIIAKSFTTPVEAMSALFDAEWLSYAESEDASLNTFKASFPKENMPPAKKKKIANSYFCGPNRSFPVTDCSEVQATKSFVGHASLSGTARTKILNNISRKSTAMGCSLKKEDSVKTKDETKTEVSSVSLKDAPMVVTLTEYKEPVDIFTLKDNEVLVGPGSIRLDLPFVVTLLDEVTQLRNSVKELESVKKDQASYDKTVKAIRDELALTHEDLTNMADRLVTQEELIIKEKASRLADRKILSGDNTEYSKLVDSMITLSVDEIDKQLTDMSAKIDMKQIADSINTGMSRTPAGGIKDPTLSLETGKKVFDKKQVTNIQEEYLRIKFGGSHPQFGRGAKAADAYIKHQQALGNLPTN